jgi:hypothetical protein
MKAKLVHISLLNSDCPSPALEYACLSWDEGDGFLQRRCRWATAAAVVMFLGFFIILVGGLLEYLGGRRKRGIETTPMNKDQRDPYEPERRDER